MEEIREIILAKIAEALKSVYDETPGDLTFDNVLSRLAFKADPLLNELRLAIERLQRGEYGACIFCKQEIPFRMLRELPTAHFCESCSSILRKRTGTSPLSLSMNGEG
jgi:RNA polymerase-binding transcription factor DksA